MKIGDLVLINQSINSILQYELKPVVTFKLIHLQNTIKPDAESALEALKDYIKKNEGKELTQAKLDEAQEEIFSEEVDIELEPFLKVSDLPKKVIGADIKNLMPIIIQEEDTNESTK